MKTGILLPILVLILLAPLASAGDDNVELEITTTRDDYRGTGTIDISGDVRNTHPDSDVSGVEISVTGNGDLAVSGEETVSIKADDKEDFEITLSGEVTKKYDITITAHSSNESIEGDSVSVDVLPPELDLEIISPKEEITWVVEHIEDYSDVSFDVMVKNTGESNIPEAFMTIDYDESKISCNWDSKGKSIAEGRSSKFSVSCSNVSSGDRITIEVEEGGNRAYDIEAVEFDFVERVKKIELQINSPVENAEYRIGEFGGSIKVRVENTGEDDLQGVCPAIEQIQSEPVECKDIAIGEEKNFSVGVVPEKNLTTARIVVTDEENQTEDTVTVRVIKIEMAIPEKNQTQTPKNRTPDNTTEANDTVVDTKEETAGIFEQIPPEFFIILAIAIPLIILLAYIKASLSKVET